MNERMNERGFPSANSMDVIPRDQMSLCEKIIVSPSAHMSRHHNICHVIITYVTSS